MKDSEGGDILRAMPTPAQPPRRSKLALTFLLFAGLGACQAPPQVEARFTRTPELLQVNPNDIAILKIEDATPGGQAMELLDYMRQHLEQQIVRRHYAPLGLVHVDAHVRAGSVPGVSVTDAGYLKSVANKAGEEALLALKIRRWDESTLLIDNRVRFDVEVCLFGSNAGKPLWLGDLRGEVVAGGRRAAPRERRERAKAAVREMIKEVTLRMPRHRL